MSLGATFGEQWVGWYLAVNHEPDHERPWKVEYTDGIRRIHVASYRMRVPADKLVDLLKMLDGLDETMYAAEVQRKALNDYTDSQSG